MKSSGHPRDILWTLIQDADASQEKLRKISNNTRLLKGDFTLQIARWLKQTIFLLSLRFLGSRGSSGKHERLPIERESSSAVMDHKITRMEGHIRKLLRRGPVTLLHASVNHC